MITREKIEKAIRYLERQIGDIKRYDGKWRKRQEIRLRRKLKKHFKNQANWIVEHLDELPQLKGVRLIKTKDIQRDAKELIDKMPYNDEIVDDISITAKASYIKGGLKIYNQFKLGEVGMSFELVNDGAVEYLKRLKTLHLSDYKGSITGHTKKRIVEIITQSVENGLNYEATAEKIIAQTQSGVFSQARAEMIAVRESGLAYGHGNKELVDRYIQEFGVEMEKSWITAGDDRVTPECAENESEGWIDINATFPNTGQQYIAPRSDNPRCRCDTGYRVKE